MIGDRQDDLLRLRALRRDAARADRAAVAEALAQAKDRLVGAEAVLRRATAAHDHLARNGYADLMDRAISGPALAHVGQRIDALAEERDRAAADRDDARDRVTALRAELAVATRRLMEADRRHEAWAARVADAIRAEALRREDRAEQARIEDRVGRGP
ncbi:MAG: hypothetical protein AAF390_15695 [Pseudomonadota bacterium]